MSPARCRADDAPLLAELWTDVLRRVDREDQVADLEPIIERRWRLARASGIVVAEYDGEVAGAVYLEATTLTAAQPRAGRAGGLAARVPAVPPARRRHAR